MVLNMVCRARRFGWMGAFAMLAWAAPAAAQLEVGDKAPAAAVETLDGAAANLSAFIGGKPTLIEFWATWCPNCKALEPQISAAAKKYGDRVRLVAVAVSANQTPPRIKAYLERNGLPMTFLFDRRGHATGAYDVFATSTIFVVDASGAIVYAGAGADQDIDAALAKAF